MPQVEVTKSTAYGREMRIVEIQPLSQRCIDLCLEPQHAAAGRGGGAAARPSFGAADYSRNKKSLGGAPFWGRASVGGGVRGGWAKKDTKTKQKNIE